MAPWISGPAVLNENRVAVQLKADAVDEEQIQFTVEGTDDKGLLSLIAEGTASQDFQTINIQLTNDSKQSALDQLSEEVNITDPMRIEAGFSRTGDALKGGLLTKGPSLIVRGETLRNLDIKFDLAGTLPEVSGQIDIKGDARKYDAFSPLKVSAKYLSEPGITIRLSDVDASLPGVMAKGNLTLLEGLVIPVGNFEATISNLSDVLFVPEGTSGSFKMTAANDTSNPTQPITFKVLGEEISFNGTYVNGLDVKARGTQESIRINTKLTAFGNGPTPLVENLASDLSLDITSKQTVVQLKTLEGVVSDEFIKLTKPTKLVKSDTMLELQRAILQTSSGGQLSLNAKQDSTTGDLSANANISNFLVPGMPILANGSANVATKSGNETARLDLKIASQTRPTLPHLNINGNWNGARVNLNGAFLDQNEKDRSEFLKLAAPLTRSQSGAFETGALSGSIDYVGTLQEWLAFLDMEDQSVRGDFKIAGKLAGTVEKPTMDATVEISKARYVHDVSGIDIENLNLNASFKGSSESARFSSQFKASDGSDTEQVPAFNGHFDGQFAKGSSEFSGKLVLQSAQLVRNEDVTAQTNADLNFSGSLQQLTISGGIDIDEVDYAIPSSSGPSVPKLHIVQVDKPVSKNGEDEEESSPFLEKIKLAIAVSANNRIFVRGRGLDSEWSTKLDVGGTAAEPALDGKISIVRGALDFGGRSFEFEKGLITFDPNAGLDPYLSISAASETKSDIKAGLKITGRASKPSISLYSNPTLPQDDIMSYVLFGKPAQNLSALETVQVARAVAQLTNFGGLGGGGSVLGFARKFAGVDVLSVNTEGDAVGLSAGKYIRDGVFVSVNQDLSGQAGNVSVEIEATDNITVATDVGQDADASVSINWKKDY